MNCADWNPVKLYSTNEGPQTQLSLYAAERGVAVLDTESRAPKTQALYILF